MTNAKENHPITPPPELIREWAQYHDLQEVEALWRTIATKAARWGADQELEACVEWMAERYGQESHAMGLLCTARRPKPPSLKEQALAVLDDAYDRLDAAYENILRRALEQLDD